MDIKELKEQTKLYTSTFGGLLSLSVAIGFLLRIIFLFNEQTEISFSFLDWIKIFGLGLINDICAGIVACFFMWLTLIFQFQSKYKKPFGYIIFGLIVIAFCYVAFCNTIFDEYGSVVPKIVRYFLLYKLISFGIRLFVPKMRKGWSMAVYYLTFFLYVVIITGNGIGEYLFWDEFGVRYNFIAVDYLIYTHEVIGNIFESYPIIPLFAILILISAAITYFMALRVKPLFDKFPSFKIKLLTTGIYFLSTIFSCVLLNFNTKLQSTDNVYVNELQSNGTFKFYTAFMNNELDYNRFYSTLPEREVFEILNKEYNSKGQNNQQSIKDSLSEIHKNIILITIESMSASYLEHYGNTENITPNLNKLIKESLIFNNIYATGNRTVRGLEAVTLCLPPSAGESIIKQPNNSNLFSTGKVLNEKGYTVQFLYGGDSYFDNMGKFFSGNGYEIIDKKKFAKEDITFSNIWGVCDEDMFNKALSVFNSDAEKGKPFFGHIMTVSNHRPFTYPENRIDIPADSKSRNGGIKYTDYAIGKFLDKARKQSWFENTIFIITADHCASSAGKTEIPLDKYHIPAIIYAPGFIKPQEIDSRVSQIDIMPTVFGLLHFSYDSYFYGKNIFSPDYKPRALVATYQNLGYWQNNILTVLSPVRKIEQFEVKQNNNYEFAISAKYKQDSIYIKKTIANYQSANHKINMNHTIKITRYASQCD